MKDFVIESISGRSESKLLRFNGKKIINHDSYHSVFAKALGFPDFYGRNAAAWIDCMSSIDIPEDELSQIHVGKGGTLTIQVENYKYFIKSGSDQWQELIECSSFVNYRRIEDRRRPVLALSFFE